MWPAPVLSAGLSSSLCNGGCSQVVRGQGLDTILVLRVLQRDGLCITSFSPMPTCELSPQDCSSEVPRGTMSKPPHLVQSGSSAH